jgi:hypothetical protein
MATGSLAAWFPRKMPCANVQPAFAFGDLLGTTEESNLVGNGPSLADFGDLASAPPSVDGGESRAGG